MRAVLRIIAMGALIMALRATSAAAGDWARWRGSDDGNGVADAAGLPETFDQTTGKADDTRKLKNVKWVVRLGGCTYGSPVVAGGKVYVGGASDFRGTAMLWCFRESDGKMLWRMRSPDWPKLVNRTCGICCTPTVEGDRVYLLGHHGEVLCLDANGLAGRAPSPDDLAFLTAGRICTPCDIPADGRRIIDLSPGTPVAPEPTDAHILWQYDMLREVNCWPHDAQTGAVLIRGDRAYVATGSVLAGYPRTNDAREWVNRWKKQYGKTSYDSPSLIVLDKNTGKLLAADQAGIFDRTYNGAHSSPSLGKVNGKELLFYGGGDGTCYAFDPDFAPGEDGKPGVLKLVWKFDCRTTASGAKGQDAQGNPPECLATPVVYNNRVYVSVGHDLDNRDPDPGTGRLLCLDATQAGDVTETAKVWSFDEIATTSSTVSISNGLLFTADGGGGVYCLDADTGSVLWSHKASKSIWSSPVVADGKVFLTSRSEVLVFAAAKEKKLLGRTVMRDLMAASPAVANGVLYIATDKFLYALQSGMAGSFDPSLSPWTAPEADGTTRPSTAGVAPTSPSTTKAASTRKVTTTKKAPATRKAAPRAPKARRLPLTWLALAGTAAAAAVVISVWAARRSRKGRMA